MLGEPVSAFFIDAGSPIIFSVQHTENTIFDMVLLTRSVPELNAYNNTQDDISMTRSSVNISQMSGPSGIHPTVSRSHGHNVQSSPARQQQLQQHYEEPLFPSETMQRNRNNSASDLVMLPLQSGNSNNSNGSQSRSRGEQNMFAFGSPKEDDEGSIKRRRITKRPMAHRISQGGSGSDTDDGSGLS